MEGRRIEYFDKSHPFIAPLLHTGGSRQECRMRTLVIGDIHGCATALDTILETVRPGRDDVLITLGDYVDRGPDSKSVLNTIIALESQTQLKPLIGNHEILFLDAMARSFEAVVRQPPLAARVPPLRAHIAAGSVQSQRARAQVHPPDNVWVASRAQVWARKRQAFAARPPLPKT